MEQITQDFASDESSPRKLTRT